MLYSWQLAVAGLCMLWCDFSIGMLVALDSMFGLADDGFTRVGIGHRQHVLRRVVPFRYRGRS